MGGAERREQAAQGVLGVGEVDEDRKGLAGLHPFEPAGRAAV